MTASPAPVVLDRPGFWRPAILPTCQSSKGFLLTATAGDAQVALGWTACANATSYNVKRSTTSGGPYTTVASPTTVSYTNTGLTNGTTYYYVASAVNASDESANSSQVGATPQASGMNNNTPTGTNASTSAYQVTTDSNCSTSFPGTLATDASLSTKWCSNGNAPPHWITIDLGSTKAVNGFIVRLAGAGGEYTTMSFRNFKFQSGTSITGPWTDEATVDNTAQANVVARSYNTPSRCGMSGCTSPIPASTTMPGCTSLRYTRPPRWPP
jgi:hypothetical protein